MSPSEAGVNVAWRVLKRVTQKSFLRGMGPAVDGAYSELCLGAKHSLGLVLQHRAAADLNRQAVEVRSRGAWLWNSPLRSRRS